MATKFITVSIEIMHDKNLNQSQKFLLAEIEQLSQLDNGCYASNKHFSDLIGITKENVSRNINELQKMGYIEVRIKAGSRNHTRIITLTEIVRPPYQNSKTPLLKQQDPLTKVVRDYSNKTSNIQINTTVNNIVEEIVNHLNDVLNKNYKHTGQKIKSLINARLKEGFTLKDFQKVHIVKFSEWNNTDMQKYLRPETLYGTKFESYLNQELSEYEKAKVICKMKGITMQELMQQGEDR